MKNFTVYLIIAFFLTLSSCTKTEEPAPAAMRDSTQLQIDSLKAELAAMRRTHVRHSHGRISSKFTIDTTQLQQSAHDLEEQQDEANEADHQPAADTAAKKVTVSAGKNTVVVQTKDTVAPSKNIFQKIMGIFSKKK